MLQRVIILLKQNTAVLPSHPRAPNILGYVFKNTYRQRHAEVIR